MVNIEGGSSQSQGPGPVQGELAINLPKESTHVELSKEELIQRAYATLLLFAEKAVIPLYDKVSKGEGKQIISSTEEGRPGEELLDIDQTGENALKAAIRETQLPAIVISENAPEPHVFGNGGLEKLFVFADPFDNTSQYKRGLDTPPYTVVSIWDKDGQPIGGVVGDIKNRKAYVSLGKETFVIDLKEKIDEREKYIERKNTLLENQKKLLEKINELQISTNVLNPEQLAKANEDYANSEKTLQEFEKSFLEAQKRDYKREKISLSERTTLLDKNSTLATFMGEKVYSLKFLERFDKLIEAMDPKGLLYAGGGAYIYGFLASGAVEAYVMFGEPLSEIIPGLPILIAAGGGAVSINPDGTYEEIKINPTTLLQDHKLYAEGSIPLFIAYNTPQVRDEIIRYYVESDKEIKLKQQLEK